MDLKWIILIGVGALALGIFAGVMIQKRKQKTTTVTIGTAPMQVKDGGVTVATTQPVKTDPTA
jgi:hypothetical protein